MEGDLSTLYNGVRSTKVITAWGTFLLVLLVSTVALFMGKMDPATWQASVQWAGGASVLGVVLGDVGQRFVAMKAGQG